MKRDFNSSVFILPPLTGKSSWFIVGFTTLIKLGDDLEFSLGKWGGKGSTQSKYSELKYFAFQFDAEHLIPSPNLIRLGKVLCVKAQLLSCLQVCGAGCEVKPGLHGLKFNTWCPTRHLMNSCLWKKLSQCSDLAQITLGLWLPGKAGTHYPSTGYILFSCGTTAGSAPVKWHFWCF